MDMNRVMRIMELRFEGLKTLREIGEKYGVTRQRIEQIISSHTPDGGTGGIMKHAAREEYICKNCGETKTILSSQNRNRKFCSKNCMKIFTRSHKHCYVCGINDMEAFSPRVRRICRKCNARRTMEYYKKHKRIKAK